MNRPRSPILTASLALAITFLNTAISGTVPHPSDEARAPSGLHDFDFLVGRWRVHHRKLKERLVDNHDWVNSRVRWSASR